MSLKTVVLAVTSGVRLSVTFVHWSMSSTKRY